MTAPVDQAPMPLPRCRVAVPHACHTGRSTTATGGPSSPVPTSGCRLVSLVDPHLQGGGGREPRSPSDHGPPDAGLRAPRCGCRAELNDNRAAHGHGGMDVHGHRQRTRLHVWARPPVGSIASGRRGRSRPLAGRSPGWPVSDAVARPVDINADHNPMPPHWTSANDAGPLTSTRAPHGRPTLHLENERPARDPGFESLRFRSSSAV